MGKSEAHLEIWGEPCGTSRTPPPVATFGPTLSMDAVPPPSQQKKQHASGTLDALGKDNGTYKQPTKAPRGTSRTLLPTKNLANECCTHIPPSTPQDDRTYGKPGAPGKENVVDPAQDLYAKDIFL